MTIQKNLGHKCHYAEKCSLYQGENLPRNMDRTIWRNVFCYRGIKGWNNCEQYHIFEKEARSTKYLHHTDTHSYR